MASSGSQVPDYRHRHPQLGEVVGLSRDGDIVQFRGLPFAEIPGRFRQAKLLESLPATPFDARQPGAYCPQPPLPFPPYWHGEPVSGYPDLVMPPMNEFACLNVDITAPRAAVEGGQADLPVLFFIHGGAYVGGSHSIQVNRRELLDGADLVRASVAGGRPIVLVTCNYRVGPLGFLASEELAAFNRAHGEPVGNYGLHDQRQALAWCARFIGGFGGNADAVTIHGTSAGGSSVHFQSVFPGKRLFKRVIASSGTMIGIGPMSMTFQQKNFDAYVAKMAPEPSELSALELVQKLQEYPVDKMIQPVTANIYYPVIDDEWIKGGRLADVEVSQDDGRSEPDLMIGSCAYEQDLTEMLLLDRITGKPLPDEEARGKLMALFGSNGMVTDAGRFPPPAVAEAYGIAKATGVQQPAEAFLPWAELTADVAFRIPPLHIALKHQTSDVLVYSIEATNPYPAWTSSYGRSNHAINDLFLFNPAEDQVPEPLKDGYRGAVDQIRSAWLDFCYGIHPWKPFSSKDGSRGSLGPVFTFQNGPKGSLHETLEDAFGAQTAAKWRLILQLQDAETTRN